MKYWHEIINCKEHFSQSCRIDPFIIVGYEFDYSTDEDKAILDALLQDASKLAADVYPGAANDSASSRPHNRILANCIAGVVSEYCWKHFLNFKKISVRSTQFESASNQIDLEVIANRKKIEVRSSFPRNGIAFAVCHPIKEFDILGPYSNGYKPGEVKKDYFIRTLFHLNSPLDIIQKVKSNSFTVYLTGGATYQMMFDDRFSKNKTLIPEDQFFVEAESSYRVVPFHNALDCKQIYSLIYNEK